MKTGKISIINLMIFVSVNANAHKEWVHQYIVGEGFKFVEREYNLGIIQKIKSSNLSDLKSKIFFSDGSLLQGLGTSNDDAPWEDDNGKYVVVGAWREDIDDPIVAYSNILGHVLLFS